MEALPWVFVLGVVCLLFSWWSAPRQQPQPIVPIAEPPKPSPTQFAEQSEFVEVLCNVYPARIDIEYRKHGESYFFRFAPQYFSRAVLLPGAMVVETHGAFNWTDAARVCQHIRDLHYFATTQQIGQGNAAGA